MKQQAPRTHSRRARPSKNPLSVDAIVSAALDIMTHEGLDGLSLRKVAAALDTGPASLYVYVDNLDALYSLMLDRAFGKVAIPPPSRGDWRKRLSALMLSYLKVLMSMPGLGQLALTSVSAGQNSLHIMEGILAALRESGIDDNSAAWAVDTLLLQITAIAAEQDARRRQPSPVASFEKAINEISSEAFPNVHAIGNKFFEGAPRERVRWTLEVLINGVLNTPRA